MMVPDPKDNEDECHHEDLYDEAEEESFPASDPPAAGDFS